MKNSSEVFSLALGNRLFRERDYSAAKAVYLKCIFQNPELESTIAANILLCNRFLASPAFKSAVVESKKVEAGKNISELLATEISVKPNQTATNIRQETFTLLNTIDQEQIHQANLVSIIICARSSPFQRDLLWYLGWRLKQCTSLNLRNFPESAALTLFQLVLLATDIEYWLIHRVRIARILQSSNIGDVRAYDLVDQKPSEILESSIGLPPFRIPNGRPYRWRSLLPASEKDSADAVGTSIDFGTILLNEKKFIGLNLLQHYHLCTSWTLVEGACQGYPPRKVSSVGLSLDNCSAQIRLFPDPLNKIRYIQHGWTGSGGEAAKSEMRNRYLERCTSDLLLVIDADEFYLEKHVAEAVLKFADKNVHAVTLPQVHFWKSTEIFITGEYYDVAHTRFFRNHPGMRYIRNHNFPELGEKFVQEMGAFKFQRTVQEVFKNSFKYLEPSCFHMGFAKDHADMRDKSDYYINRGEAITRKATTDSRSAWFDGNLPEKCLVRSWVGDMPEILKP
jgi:hypothetical protein